jgi:heme-degrading monooxygenase HmoA
VNITEFTMHRPWHLLAVSRAGMRLRETWPRTEGALGMWLWVDPHPLRPRCGSISVWRDEEAVRAFVARPDHRRIVEAHRDKGRLRSATWRSAPSDSDRQALRASALRVLTGEQAWPVTHR